MTLDVFTKDVYAAILHYLLDDDHASIPILHSGLVSRQSIVSYIMKNLDLIPNLNDSDLIVMLTSCMDTSISFTQCRWEAAFPSFSLLGGLIGLFSIRHSIDCSDKDNELVTVSAKRILQTLQQIAIEGLQIDTNSNVVVAKLMRRDTNIVHSSLFPILLFVLLSKDSGVENGNPSAFDRSQYSRRSKTDVSFCLSSSSSLQRLAYSLLPFALPHSVDSSPLRRDDYQLMLMIFYAYYHELCVGSFCGDYDNSIMEYHEQGTVDYVMHKSDGSLLISNQKPDALHRLMLTSCLVGLIKAFHDDVFTRHTSQVVKIVLMNASLVVDLENTLLNGVIFSELPPLPKSSEEDMIQVLSRTVFLLHSSSTTTSTTAAEYPQVQEDVERFDGLVGILFIRDLLLLEEVSDSSQRVHQEKAVTANLYEQLVLRLLDDDCNYSCKLFHLFHTYTAELKKMFVSMKFPAVFPPSVMDYVKERVNTTYNECIRDIRVNQESLYTHLYPMTVMLQTLDHMAKKACSRFFHYSIFTRSMLETIIDSGRVVLLASGFPIHGFSNFETAISAFMSSWASLLLSLVRYSSRFDIDILAGAIRSLQFLINIGAFSSEGIYPGVNATEYFPNDTSQQSSRENNLSVNCSYCSAVVQTVVTLLRRRDRTAATSLKRKQGGSHVDTSVLTNYPRIDIERVREPPAVGLSDNYSSDNNLEWSVVYISFLYLQITQTLPPSSSLISKMDGSENFTVLVVSSLELLRRVLVNTAIPAVTEDLHFCCNSLNPPATFHGLSRWYIESIAMRYVVSGESLVSGLYEEISSPTSLKGQLVSNLLSLLTFDQENMTVYGNDRHFNDIFSNVYTHRSSLIYLCQEIFLCVLKRRVIQILETPIHDSEVEQNIVEDLSRNLSVLVSYVFDVSEKILDLVVEDTLHYVQVDGMLKSLFTCLLDKSDRQKNLTIIDMLTYCSDIVYSRLISNYSSSSSQAGQTHANMSAVCLFFSICLAPTAFTSKLQVQSTSAMHTVKVQFNYSSLDKALRMVSLPVAFARHNKHVLLRWIESCYTNSIDGVILGPAVLTFSILTRSLSGLLLQEDITVDIAVSFSYWRTCSLDPDDFSFILSLSRISDPIQVAVQTIGTVDNSNDQTTSCLFFCLAASLLHELQFLLSTIQLSVFQSHMPVAAKMVKIFKDMYLGYISDSNPVRNSIINYFCMEQLLYMLGTLHDTVVLNLPRMADSARECVSLLSEIVSMAHTLQLSFRKMSPYDPKIEGHRRSTVASILQLSVSSFEHLQAVDAESVDECHHSCILHILHLFCSDVLLLLLDEGRMSSFISMNTHSMTSEQRSDLKERYVFIDFKVFYTKFMICTFFFVFYSHVLAERIHRVIEAQHTVSYCSGSQMSTTALLLFQYLTLKIAVRFPSAEGDAHNGLGQVSFIAVSKFTPRGSCATAIWLALEEDMALRDPLAKTLMQVTCELMYYTPQQDQQLDVLSFMARVYRFCILCMFSTELLNSDRYTKVLEASMPASAILFRCLLLQCQELLLAVGQSLHILQDCLGDGNGSERDGNPQHHSQIKLLHSLLEHLQYCAAMFAHSIVSQPPRYSPPTSSSSFGATAENDSLYNPIQTMKGTLRCQPWHRIFLDNRVGSKPPQQTAPLNEGSESKTEGGDYSYIRLAGVNRNFNFFDMYKTFIQCTLERKSL